MKYTNTPCALLIIAISLLCMSSCSKSGGSNPTPTKPVEKTTVQLLESSPWNISKVFVTNETTTMPWPIGIPDSLKNLVLTLNADNSFTETGGKSASGTWTYVATPNPLLTLTTTTAPASIVPWNVAVSATALGIGNVFIQTTYVNPALPLQSYVGENVYFTH